MGNNGHPDQLDWIRTVLVTYEDRLVRYAQRIVRDESLARDVVQETFLKLCRQDRADLNGRLAQWLYTVCRNQALDQLRKESRMSAAIHKSVDNGSGDRECPDPVELHDEMQRVLVAMEHLTPNQQECLRLKFEHGLGYREIADITGQTVSNVGFVIHAGLTRLRARLVKGAADG